MVPGVDYVTPLLIPCNLVLKSLPGGGGGGIEGQMQMGHQTAPTYVAKIWQFGASILWYIVIMPNYSLAQLTTKDLEDLIGKTKATLLEVVNESKTSLLRIESELKKV